MARRTSRYDPYDDGPWPSYVPVAERRRKAKLAMERLQKKGHAVSPVRIEGRAIANTFWGKAWCDNLERYRDYENRIERVDAHMCAAAPWWICRLRLAR